MLGMFFGSKRGMSPLIATVLLIAFAVALGTMIMNWSKGAEGNPDLEVAACEGVSITTEFGACYSGNQVSFSLENDGAKKIDAIRIIIRTPSADYDLKVKDSSMIRGERLERSIPFILEEDALEVEFVPTVVDQGDLAECSSAALLQETLETC